MYRAGLSLSVEGQTGNSEVVTCTKYWFGSPGTQWNELVDEMHWLLLFDWNTLPTHPAQTNIQICSNDCKNMVQCGKSRKQFWKKRGVILYIYWPLGSTGHFQVNCMRLVSIIGALFNVLWVMYMSNGLSEIILTHFAWYSIWYEGLIISSFNLEWTIICRYYQGSLWSLVDDISKGTLTNSSRLL